MMEIEEMVVKLNEFPFLPVSAESKASISHVDVLR